RLDANAHLTGARIDQRFHNGREFSRSRYLNCPIHCAHIASFTALARPVGVFTPSVSQVPEFYLPPMSRRRLYPPLASYLLNDCVRDHLFSNPNFRRRPYNCVRDIPSRLAARTLLPSASRIARSIASFSSVSRSVVLDGGTFLLACRQRCSASMSGPSHVIK